MSSYRIPRRIIATFTSLGCALGLGCISSPASADASGLIINEFYGRGGSANQPYQHKFVEVYNPRDVPVDLAGLSLQYRSATGTGSATSTTKLQGSIAARGYFLIQLGSNGDTGEALPRPDLVAANVNPSGTNGTIYLAQAGSAVSPDAEAVLDKLGYGTSNSPEAKAARYTGTNSTPGSLTRTEFADTNDNSADFAFTSQPTPQAGNTAAAPPSPSPDVVSIADIQGTSGTGVTPLEGSRVTTRGVVTAAYPTGGFNGAYLQTPGTGGSPKAEGEASDGIFVASAAAAGLGVGDCVLVTGTASESRGLTQLGGSVAVDRRPAAECEPVKPTTLDSLPATDAHREAYEGMLVLPSGPYTITNNYALNQYGQLGLAQGDKPLRQATDAVPPGDRAKEFEVANQARLITLDDGSSWNYLTNKTAQATALPYVSTGTPMRTGTPVSFTTPVILDYRYQWNFQPLGQVSGHDSKFIPVTASNTREATPPSVGGDITLASFNVLNYFTDLGEDEEGCTAYTDRGGAPVSANNCQVRGAYSRGAFLDQQAKIVAAINALDADVVGLMEVENSAGLSYVDHPRDAALASLVKALNDAAGEQRWGYVPSPAVTPPSEDVIRTAFIYQTTTVAPVGPSEIGMHTAANARAPLAQRFKALGGGLEFVAVVNHFKSKGSGVDDDTGQGLSNPSREAQAKALAAWAGDLFSDDAVFLLGDFNAYTQETPLRYLRDAGYTNVVKAFEPDSASYQFQGRLGSLDHVFANAKAMASVTGGGIWDINGDESVAFQYSRRNYNVVDFYAGDQYASSDHDPLLIGLRTTPRRPAPGPSQPSAGQSTPGASSPGDSTPAGRTRAGHATRPGLPRTGAAG